MKTKFTLFFLLTLAFVNAQVPSIATKKSLGNDMVAREQSGFASRNNKLYIIGGAKDLTEYDPATGIMNKLKNYGSGHANPLQAKCSFIVQNKLYFIQDITVHTYDFITNTWASSFQLPVPTNFNADSGFVINNVIYVCSSTANFVCSYNTINGQAAQKADFPGQANRNNAFGFAINGKGYLGAGYISKVGPAYLNSFYEYDPTNDTWTIKANLPIGFNSGVGISVNGKGYAGSGLITDNYQSVLWYEYNPISNTWTSKQNFMNLTQILDNNNVGRTNASVTSIGDDIFLFGGAGQYSTGKEDGLHKYNTVTNTWSVVDEDLGKNRRNAGGFFFNGKVYVGGGEDEEALNDFWEYDTATDNWIQKANMPNAHCQRAVGELGGKGYFVGGYSPYIRNTTANPEAQWSDRLDEYNPVTNSWTSKAPYPAGKRRGMIAMSYNGKLYAGQGSGVNGRTNGFFEYNPATNTWTSKMSVPFVGENSGHFVIGNIGYVLKDSFPFLVAKYNFDTNSWTTESSSVDDNSGFGNSAFSYNGFGYAAHGGFSNNSILSKYNPATSTWSQLTNLSFANSGQNLIPANNGVYIGFGTPGLSHPLGLSQVNDWRFMKFDATVSDKFGVYSTIFNVGTNFGITANPVRCGTGNLSTSSTYSVFDNNGDLFSTITAGTSGNQGTCHEITSLNLSIPFKTADRNFGNNIVETGMFLNKNITFPSNNILGPSGTFRLYYTTVELNKLVTDFNTLYGTNKTSADIKLVRYMDTGSVHDANPLNNTNGNHAIFATTTGNYGADKFYDIALSNSSTLPSGEIYAVLLAGQI